MILKLLPKVYHPIAKSIPQAHKLNLYENSRRYAETYFYQKV